MGAVHECFEKVNSIGSASPSDLPPELLSGLTSLRKQVAELEQRRATFLQLVDIFLTLFEANERLLGELDGVKESLLRREPDR